MADIPLDTAELIALLLETFLYGIFFTLFWVTFCILWKNRTEEKPNHFLIGALIFMLILSTAHTVIDFVRVIEAFIVHAKPGLGGPVVYYAQISHPLHVAKNILYASLSLTGDMVMTWRCYVVFHRNRLVVIIPCLLIISGALCGYAAVWSLHTAPAGSTIFATSTKRWITSFFVLTLSTNTYCTALIVYRIWTTIHSLGPCKRGSRSLMPVLMAAVESGGLYASALLALLITYISKSNGQFAALDVVTPIIGIVFTLIIIQISTYTSEMIGSTVTAASWRSARRSNQAAPSNYATHPVDINIATQQALHIDYAHSHTFSTTDASKQSK